MPYVLMALAGGVGVWLAGRGAAQLSQLAIVSGVVYLLVMKD